jgi:hypothetical protein
MGVAWDDNRLRVAIVRTQALLALDRRSDAEAFVAEVLASAGQPADEVQVRTHRYRDQLTALVAEAP